jgi:hypothetical protein
MAEGVRESWKLAFPSSSALRRLHWPQKRPKPQGETTQKLSFLKKTRWAINDKSKFESLIRDVRDLVDGLYAILPVSDKERDRTSIQDIVSLLPDLARPKLGLRRDPHCRLLHDPYSLYEKPPGLDYVLVQCRCHHLAVQ